MPTIGCGLKDKKNKDNSEQTETCFRFINKDYKIKQIVFPVLSTQQKLQRSVQSIQLSTPATGADTIYRRTIVNPPSDHLPCYGHFSFSQCCLGAENSSSSRLPPSNLLIEILESLLSIKFSSQGTFWKAMQRLLDTSICQLPWILADPASRRSPPAIT